jgi:hypothetical protein
LVLPRPTTAAAAPAHLPTSGAPIPAPAPAPNAPASTAGHRTPAAPAAADGPPHAPPPLSRGGSTSSTGSGGARASGGQGGVDPREVQRRHQATVAAAQPLPGQRLPTVTPAAAAAATVAAATTTGPSAPAPAPAPASPVPVPSSGVPTGWGPDPVVQPPRDWTCVVCTAANDLLDATCPVCLLGKRPVAAEPGRGGGGEGASPHASRVPPPQEDMDVDMDVEEEEGQQVRGHGRACAGCMVARLLCVASTSSHTGSGQLNNSLTLSLLLCSHAATGPRQSLGRVSVRVPAAAQPCTCPRPCPSSVHCPSPCRRPSP